MIENLPDLNTHSWVFLGHWELTLSGVGLKLRYYIPVPAVYVLQQCTWIKISDLYLKLKKQISGLVVVKEILESWMRYDWSAMFSLNKKCERQLPVSERTLWTDKRSPRWLLSHTGTCIAWLQRSVIYACFSLLLFLLWKEMGFLWSLCFSWEESSPEACLGAGNSVCATILARMVERATPVTTTPVV